MGVNRNHEEGSEYRARIPILPKTPLIPFLLIKGITFWLFGSYRGHWVSKEIMIAPRRETYEHNTRRFPWDKEGRIPRQPREQKNLSVGYSLETNAWLTDRLDRHVFLRSKSIKIIFIVIKNRRQRADNRDFDNFINLQSNRTVYKEIIIYSFNHH